MNNRTPSFSREEIEHGRHLDEIMKDLTLIKESNIGVRWIMREGIYMPNKFMTSFPDLIIVYSGFAIPVEYKHSIAHKDRAIEQLTHGTEFIRTELKLDCPRARFVSYSDSRDRYISEVIIK